MGVIGFGTINLVAFFDKKVYFTKLWLVKTVAHHVVICFSWGGGGRELHWPQKVFINNWKEQTFNKAF